MPNSNAKTLISGSRELLVNCMTIQSLYFLQEMVANEIMSKQSAYKLLP